ncbi:hypothetical protein BCR39DRAFT_578799 [Naematelia encephala]|uniref:Uncharacterized protein n=1 Tax=Naematelia encephala TaxID=71784 RepID=A0A1Y2AXI1_9TREE|nr:hypothetical protein BCR39DRAFT_578799 [Naematelia encephala]
MLLRLLPIATPSQPAPPTILFTLPMPTHPYTARSLPLPPNLLAHRSVCLQEDIECSNVLLGEKSSWIAGTVDDVTFSLPANQVEVHLIDGSNVTLPLEPACLTMLQRVVHEVQLSFAPPPQEVTSTRTSCSSISSVASSSSATPSRPSRPSISIPAAGRRSTSSLLLSLLSPLLQTAQQTQIPEPRAAPPQPPARAHRRQARSLLVDTYRLHVLPALRQHLPPAYLPWMIASETQKKGEEFESLRDEINDLLELAGVDLAVAHATPMKRTRSGSSCSDSDSDSDSDITTSPVTPATSVFSSSVCCTPVVARRTLPTPQSFLLSIPPAHVLPPAHRNTYAAQLARLTRLASRLHAIKKLGVRYEREEGKRRWLEGLERGRAGDKALRRAFSNGQLKGALVTAEPIKASKLWRSTTVADLERAEVAAPTHPAMLMESIAEVESYASSESEGGSDSMDRSEDGDEQLQYPRRPSLTHRDTCLSLSARSAAESDEAGPGLTASASDESLAESDEWDREVNQAQVELLPAPAIMAAKSWDRAALGAPIGRRPAKTLLTDFDRSEMDEDESERENTIVAYGSVEVVYA